MSKVSEYVQQERDIWGKIYVDINYAIDNISSFLSKEILNNRSYVKALAVLKKYMELLDSAEREDRQSGFFSKLSHNKYIDLLKDYKSSNMEAFSQLEHCSKCSCLNCISECSFDSCEGCRPLSKIKYCDKSKLNLTLPDNFIIPLNNDRTGELANYKVLAVLQDCTKEQKYIVIEHLINKDKFILYYNPGIVEDSYGEISDEAEFDLIASTYESSKY